MQPFHVCYSMLIADSICAGDSTQTMRAIVGPQVILEWDRLHENPFDLPPVNLLTTPLLTVFYVLCFMFCFSSVNKINFPECLFSHIFQAENYSLSHFPSLCEFSMSRWQCGKKSSKWFIAYFHSISLLLLMFSKQKKSELSCKYSLSLSRALFAGMQIHFYFPDEKSTRKSFSLFFSQQNS